MGCCKRIAKAWHWRLLPALSMSCQSLLRPSCCCLTAWWLCACWAPLSRGHHVASLEEVDRRVTSWSGRSRSVAPPATLDLKGSGRDAGREGRGGAIPGGEHSRRFCSRVHLAYSLLTANDLGMLCESRIALTVLGGRVGRLVWQLRRGQRAARRAERGGERRGVGRAAGHWTK